MKRTKAWLNKHKRCELKIDPYSFEGSFEAVVKYVLQLKSQCESAGWLDASIEIDYGYEGIDGYVLVYWLPKTKEELAKEKAERDHKKALLLEQKNKEIEKARKLLEANGLTVIQ